MIDREYNLNNPLDKLGPYLKENWEGYKGLRRRAILGQINNKWSLISCVVEASSGEKKIETVESKIYPQAVLHEDWITSDGLIEFIKQIDKNQITLGEYALSAEPNRYWSRQQVQSKNIYMDQAGQILSIPFERNAAGAMYGALLAPNQPYYPDIEEAARDWLPFPIYHGRSDSRNGEIILLLPETRAFIKAAETEGDIFRIKVEGTVFGKIALLIRGAWWDGQGIHHFESVVSKDKYAKANIPSSATRVDCVLTNPLGTIYDYFREDNYGYREGSHSSLAVENSSLAQVILDACQRGEGPRIEFKPFVSIGDGENNKLKETIKTVVAFANTKGGHIFFGINNDCELEGISVKLAEWVKGQADIAACNKYLGAIRGRIRDVVVGELDMAFKQVFVGNFLIGIIEVSEAKEKPVYIRQDHCLYVRRGSSNTKAAPDEWKNIIGVRDMERLPWGS